MVRYCLLFAFVATNVLMPRFALAAECAKPQAAGEREADSTPRRLSSRERAAARRAERAAAEQARQEKVHAAWLGRLEAHGVEPWPEATDEVHAAARERSQKMVDDVIARLPGTRLYETEHFLFTSNMPPPEVAPYVRYLDAMYDWMCKLYGIPAGTRVWLGDKAPVFAFAQQAQFLDFEERHFQVPAEGMYGLCHQNMQGDVVIACFRGDDPNDFGQMLVHETSHGFIHRYKSKARLPSWVNEGMADLIGAEMVPQSKSVERREYIALTLVKERHSLGGNFFTAEPIDAWQYGVASSLNRFLLNTDRPSYVRFIEKLKEGQKWPDALREAFGGTPEQLVGQYGRWIGIPDLRP